MNQKLKLFYDGFLRNLTKELPLKIAAVLFALVIWFYVASTVNTETTRFVKNVPIEVSLSGSAAERNDLSLIESSVEAVTVEIRGSRAAIGNLSAEDLAASLDLDEVSSAGEYDLSVSVTGKGNKSFEILNVRPAAVKTKFDKLVTKSFDVTAEAPNIKIEEGYLKDELTCSPNTVRITGPEEQINKITKCVVKTDLSDTLKESQLVTSSNLQLYSGDSLMQTKDMDLKISQSSFSVEIPIYMKKILPLQLTIQTPGGFPLDKLKYSLSVNEIEVAAPNSRLENIQYLSLDRIALRDLEIGKSVELPISLPDGFKNLSGTESVTFTLDDSNLATKTLDIKLNNVDYIYVPDRYSISSVNTVLQGVTFIGSKEAIEKLTAADVVVQLDMSSQTVDSELFSSAVMIYVPGGELVWAIGTHTVLFRAEEK